MIDLLKREQMARALFEVDALPHQMWTDVGIDKRERYLCLADTALSQGSSAVAPTPLSPREQELASEVQRLTNRLDFLAVGFGVPDGGKYLTDWQTRIRKYQDLTGVPSTATSADAEPVAWQRRFKSSTTGDWGGWGFSSISAEEFEMKFGYLVESGNCQVRQLCVMDKRSDAMTTDAWQDISTAPRNGEPINIYVPIHQPDRRVLSAYWTDAGWWICSGSIVTGKPTHWQPLPTGPLARKDDGSEAR